MTNTATPVQIDTKLAALYGQLSKVQDRRESIWETIHHLAGDQKSWIGNRRYWGMKNGQALIALIEAQDAGTLVAYKVTQANETRAALKASGAEIKALNAQIAELNEIFNAAPWSRFFLVNNNNGHIHSATNCSTTYPTTSWSWNPELSGKTEADAVAELGEILCTVCFPSAPVAWTSGISKAAQVAQAERAAKKAAKPAIFAHRVPKGGYTETFKTQRAAEIALVGHLADHEGFGYSLDAKFVAALSERLEQAGVTAEQIADRVTAKVARDKKASAKHCKSLGMTEQADGTWSF